MTSPNDRWRSSRFERASAGPWRCSTPSPNRFGCWIATGACCSPVQPRPSALGLRPEEIVGRTMHDLLPAPVAESRRSRFDEVVRTGEPVQFEDERADMVYHHTLYPVRDPDGHVSGVAVFSRDHTARHRAEAEVERLNAQLRTRVTELERLLALTPVGVAIAEDPLVPGHPRQRRTAAAARCPAGSQRLRDCAGSPAVAHLPRWARALRR